VSYLDHSTEIASPNNNITQPTCRGG
jgi:hypothetical protein